jgi:hypothetical protein
MYCCERGFYAFHLEQMKKFPGQKLNVVKSKWNACSDDQKDKYNIIEEDRASAEVKASEKKQTDAKSKAEAKSIAKQDKMKKQP